LSLTDTQATEIRIAAIMGGNRGRQEVGPLAEYAWQFIEINRGRFAELGVTPDPIIMGDTASLKLTATSVIGAVPLRCPITAHDDHALVVEPRFAWRGIGPTMAATGWITTPTVLRLPLLPTSAREVPAWLIASAVLSRLAVLLRSSQRRFEVVEDVVSRPRGSIRWEPYASRYVARGRPDRVPCRFAELDHDRSLLAAVHFVLRKQMASMEGERGAGRVVLDLQAWCHELLLRVEHVPPRCPSSREIAAWLRSPVAGNDLRDGLEAIEWTVEDRGLAGLSDLRGLPWKLSMDEFWEAWVETVFGRVARTAGGSIAVGRTGATTTAIAWDPPYTGSQKSLRPDLVWQRQDHTFIVDAKYKAHWMELTRAKWHDLDELVREHHREDLLQVLAYGNVAETPDVTLILAYPCTAHAWQTMQRNGTGHHIARLMSGRRRTHIILTGIPLEPHLLDQAASSLTALLLQE
jgi:hypothetical protein